MSKYAQNLNEEIQILIQMLEEQDVPHLPFLPAFIENTKTLQQEVHLSDEELSLEADSVERESIEDELEAYVSKVRSGYEFLTGKELPEWAKRFQKKDYDFFSEFFENVTNESSDLFDAVEQKLSVNFDTIQSKFLRWKDLTEQEMKKSEVVNKIRRAFNVKAGAWGVLKMAGLSSFEIRKQVSG